MRARCNRLVLVLALACCTGALAPAAVQAVAPADALRLLNAQRAANQIPGDVVESAGLSDGCAKHVAYIASNGGALVSGEDPAKAGYTPEGDRQTLESSGVEVLSRDATWSDGASPWLLRPIHLFRIFDPEVAVAGYAEAGGVACMRLRGGRGAPSAPELYSVPASGHTGVAMSEVNDQAPYTPQQLVEIPAGQATGPNILLFTRGLRGAAPLSAAAFSFSGPSGAVEARLVTEGTTNATGSGSWFRGGGVVIPVAPLAPFADYVARVTWHRDADSALPAADVEQVVTFQTAGLANPIDISVVSRGDVNDLRVITPAPNPRLTLTGPGDLADIAQLRGGAVRYAALNPGTWSACARSGGKATGYVPATVCKLFTASAKVPLALATERGRTSVAVRVPRIAEGRPAQLTITRYRLACTGDGKHRRCKRQTVGRAKRVAIMLRTPRMRVKLPARAPGVKVSARILLSPFTVGDAPYLGGDIRRTWE